MSQQNDCEQSDYKLCFKLKQHTPLIHFQADQKGATLRATELKPKLDRFLIKQCQLTKIIKKNRKEKEVPKREYESWFINKGREHLALDYKVKIISQNTTYEPIEYQLLDYDSDDRLKWKIYYKNNEKNYKRDKHGNKIPAMQALPMFFANMGKEWEDNPKYLVFSYDSTVEILCFNKQLRKKIEEFFDLFIFTTNFGTRQSKGFGSFTTETIPTNEELNMLKNFTFYKFSINLDDDTYSQISYPKVNNPSENFKTYGKLFEILNIFSKTFRSGINLGGYYFKSLMYMYAQKPNWTWDKKYFKAKFLGNKYYKNKIKRQKEVHKYPEILNFDNLNNEFLLRDLLGLSTEQKWFKYNKTIQHLKENGKNVNEVTRYKSPITFKIIKQDEKIFDIYLLVSCINKNIFGKTFKITDGRKTIEISTPKNFRIDKYLNFCFSTDIDTHAVKFEKDKKDKKNRIKVEHEDDRHHKVIKSIYSQLNLQTQGTTNE